MVIGKGRAIEIVGGAHNRIAHASKKRLLLGDLGGKNEISLSGLYYNSFTGQRRSSDSGKFPKKGTDIRSHVI